MKKKVFIIGGICFAVVAGILGYNHEAVRVVFHNVYSPSVKLDDSSKWNGGKAYEKLPYSEASEMIIWICMCRTVKNLCR